MPVYVSSAHPLFHYIIISQNMGAYYILHGMWIISSNACVQISWNMSISKFGSDGLVSESANSCYNDKDWAHRHIQGIQIYDAPSTVPQGVFCLSAWWMYTLSRCCHDVLLSWLANSSCMFVSHKVTSASICMWRKLGLPALLPGEKPWTVMHSILRTHILCKYPFNV